MKYMLYNMLSILCSVFSDLNYMATIYIYILYITMTYICTHQGFRCNSVEMSDKIKSLRSNCPIKIAL